jgi:predicted transposase/invertase (TIGR01784 family)
MFIHFNKTIFSCGYNKTAKNKKQTCAHIGCGLYFCALDGGVYGRLRPLIRRDEQHADSSVGCVAPRWRNSSDFSRADGYVLIILLDITLFLRYNKNRYNVKGRVIMAEKRMFMSPLADPVVSAIFNNVEQAGLAAQSLVGSILESEGIKIGKVISVTPQKINIPTLSFRSTRVDICVETTDGERIIVEVQMEREPLLERNVFALSQDIAVSFPKNTNPWQMKKLFPTIYVINIMNHNDRDDNDDYIQPIKLMYAKPPHRSAFDNLQIYNIELPKFRLKEHDLSKSLDAWLYILDTAEQEEKTVEEVVNMSSRLQETLQNDPGIQQFMENYERVSADPTKRDEYISYAKGIYYLNGVLRCANEDGSFKAKLEDARNFLKLGVDVEIIAKGTGLPLETIKSLSLLPQ